MDSAIQLPQIVSKIIKEQELVIGPLAWHEASKVSGLIVNESQSSASFSGDGKDIVDRLVAQYEKLFGKASHELCKEAVHDLISQMSPEQIPASLK